MTAEHIFKEHNGLIGSVVHQWAGATSAVLSKEDLYSACCERIVTTIETFDPDKGTLSNGVVLVCRSAIVLEIKRLRWQKYGRIERDDRSLGTIGEWETSLTAPTEDDADLRMDLQLLPPRERFIVLSVLAGYTFEEIAEQLGVSRQRVHQIGKQQVEELNFQSALYRRNPGRRKKPVQGFNKVTW